MAESTKLRGSYVLNADELRRLTGWPDAMIEDYLSILSNIAVVNKEVDDVVERLTNVITVTTSPYEVKPTDEVVFFDTTAGDIAATLSPGTQGNRHKLVNVGLARNRVTLSPFGTEKLFGLNASEYIADQEALIVVFEETYGWN